MRVDGPTASSRNDDASREYFLEKSVSVIPYTSTSPQKSAVMNMHQSATPIEIAKKRRPSKREGVVPTQKVITLRVVARMQATLVNVTIPSQAVVANLRAKAKSPPLLNSAYAAMP